jgi:hypothetical protein
VKVCQLQEDFPPYRVVYILVWPMHEETLIICAFLSRNNVELWAIKRFAASSDGAHCTEVRMIISSPCLSVHGPLFTGKAKRLVLDTRSTIPTRLLSAKYDSYPRTSTRFKRSDVWTVTTLKPSGSPFFTFWI